MDKKKQMEQFNIAYIRSLAAHAGFKVSTGEVDDDSVDITIEGTGFNNSVIRNPKVDIQLKSTKNFKLKDNIITYALKAKNYSDLIGDNVLSPRYLVLLHLPVNDSDWLYHSVNGITLRNRCYWFSLRHLPPSANRNSVTLNIPANQVLTSSLLKDMMKAASNGMSV
ncbi:MULTISPECIES: DUF4365 domain-containing protein [Klebsiella pneumoniae complex]|uniref:DUF4365 domain-containing protein n=1 Tax=Klebsiella pneumoniae complex TaxID=3390273 RepID=UPI0007CBD1B5|nr:MULTISPECIES: DUF4365 domain-containing protein [Klebsiella]SAT75026.1 Uncharacterised protein [Klebsiella variicola]HDT5164351.1 DUF4365 domain-containing protein [Klebsiella quasipneumoniae subsp. similipneumoniae]